MLYGEISESGSIRPYNKKLWAQTINGLKGKKIEMEIRKLVKRRTTQQNRYYWLHVRAVEEYTGHDAMEIHEANKMKFLRKVIEVRSVGDGRVENVETVGSTTELEKNDGFGEFLEKVRAFWIEWGVEFPDYEAWQKENGFN